MEQKLWDRLYSYRLTRMAKLIKLNAPKEVIATEAMLVMLAAKEQTKRQIATTWLKEWYVARKEYSYYWFVRFLLGEDRADEIVFGITDDNEFENDLREVLTKGEK